MLAVETQENLIKQLMEQADEDSTLQERLAAEFARMDKLWRRVAETNVGSVGSSLPASNPAPVSTKMPSAASSADAPRTVQAPNDDFCVICRAQLADTAAVPCGHMCGCSKCLCELQSSSAPECPVCHAPMTS